MTASFQYDPIGQRVTKSVSGATGSYLYDGANLVQELSGTTPTANLLNGGLDEVFTRTDAAGVRNFLTDVLGSTVALADGTGSIQTQYTYEASKRARVREARTQTCANIQAEKMTAPACPSIGVAITARLSGDSFRRILYALAAEM